jgi:hypothetical protein
VNIIDAINDRKVFAAHFRGPTWDAWRAFLAALFALPMTPEQLAIYKQHTGRSSPPTTPHLEAWLVCGRRAGKSFTLALVAVFLATFKDWRPYLGPGEVGTIAVVCQDRKQSRTIMRFALGLLKSVPMLKRQVENVTRESIELRNAIVIEVHTASFRSTRGYTIVAALLDEVAYWPVDETSAEPDAEVVNAIKPAQATIPNAMLLCASSPYARKGVLWDAYRKHHGKDGDPVLVWQSDTRSMNPSVPQSYIDQHMADDPARAMSEYGANGEIRFRTDVEAFVLREACEACVSRDVYERPPSRLHSYGAFVDPSGGSSDSFTLAIAHYEYAKQTCVIDCIREVRPPFSPEGVVGEFAALLKSYNLRTCGGDRFGGAWVSEQFGKFNITYKCAEQAKSELYTNLLPLINSRRIQFVDHPKLINQLVGLERRVSRSGRDSIDHCAGAHDDLINSVAGVADLVVQQGIFDIRAFNRGLWGQSETDPDGIAGWRRARLAGIIANALHPR